MNAVNEDILHIQTEDAIYTIINDELEQQKGRCSIRGRGNTTWGYNEKRPYNIECSSDISFLGMSAQRKWSLLANYFDGSEMRNWIALNTAYEMGMPYSCECEYVNLYLNGYYTGLYLLCQHIDVSGGNLHIADLGKQNSILNKYSSSLFDNLRIEEKDSYGRELSFFGGDSPTDITGGYLLEFVESYDNMEARFDTDHATFVIESPRYPTCEEVYYISEYMNEVEDLIFECESEHYQRFIDLDSWTTMYLLQEFFVNWDSDKYSCYMWKDKGNDIVYSGPAWDFDISMGVGRDVRRRYTCRATWLESESTDSDMGYSGNVRWLYGMYSEHPEFKAEVKAKFYESMYPVIQRQLQQDIPILYEQIYASAQMDHMLYPDALRPAYEETLESEYSYLCEWLQARLDFYSDYYANEKDYLCASFYGMDSLLTYHALPGEMIECLPVDKDGKDSWINEITGEKLRPGDVMESDVFFVRE